MSSLKESICKRSIIRIGVRVIMFSINVFTEDTTLVEYLNIEATRDGNNVYTFSTIERAAIVFGRYVYYNLKRELLEKVVPKSTEEDDLMESFLMYLPNEYEEEWKKFVYNLVKNFLEENSQDFFIEGFMTFRMAQLKEKYLEFLKEEFDHFCLAITPTESIESLIDFMKSQPSRARELTISTTKDGQISLSEGRECFYVEEHGEQENIVLQSVFLSPQHVRVQDRYNVLKRESIMVLKQIFGQNIIIAR